ncbi:MAG: hypothetical protein AAGD38_01205 [Acidobacteriota bacterium]
MLLQPANIRTPGKSAIAEAMSTRRTMMHEHELTLVIAGDVEGESTIDALFEVGCDDATFGTIDGVGYGEFIRTASTFLDAVNSATRQIESVAGLKVARVEPSLVES